MPTKEEKMKKIKYELDCLRNDWFKLTFEEQKKRLCSLSWKIRLVGVDEEKMRAKNIKNRMSKVVLNNLAANTKSN